MPPSAQPLCLPGSVADAEPHVTDAPSVVRDERTLAALPPRPDPPPALSVHQQRELDGVLEALGCEVRQRVLLALAWAGPAHVGGLTDRINATPSNGSAPISQKTLSHHLAQLRTAGLVYTHRRGKQIWYEPAPDRVRYQRHADGRFSLTLTARDGGVGVTVEALLSTEVANGYGRSRDNHE